jgi:uncharacterized membrane protein
VISAFCDWLAATPISQTFQDLKWFVPLVQTVHILSIAVVVTAVAMTGSKLLGASIRAQSLAAMVSYFTPWVWIALATLLVTGILLTVTEPSRELLNLAFRVKMVMVLGLVGLLLIIQSRLRRDPEYWTQSPGRQVAARAIGALSLLLGVSIVVAGRWIAYV